MRHEETRTLYTVACVCGEKLTLDARSFGKPQVCRKCGNQFTVAWGKDPSTLRNTPMMVSLARKRPATPLRLACTCGYKRAVTAAEAHRQNRCPGCGKVMIVEKPAAPKNGRDSNRLIKLSSAPSTAPKMPLLPVPSKVSPESRLRSLNPPTPVPNFNNPGLVCECGRPIEVLKAMESGNYSCPACGRSVRMEKDKHSHSKHTVIRPIFGPRTPPPMPAVKPPPPKAPKGSKPPPPETVFAEDPAADSVEHEAAPMSSYQELFCPCGEALMVGFEDAGKNIQCPTCLTLIAVDVLKDSKTGGKALRVRAIGKMDQDTWSLNDFK
jgi:predicted RNA-binding Zn-ribbon protein involved in translation (DUF1610 family)